MKKGDILFLNNWITLHRRTAFNDFIEFTKKTPPENMVSVPNGRPIHSAFRDNFGAVEAGALRGDQGAKK